MLNYFISALVLAKIFLAVLTLYFFAIYLGWDMFTYPDFYSIYKNCSEKEPINILFTNLFCGLSSISGYEITYRSVFFIILAASVNMVILVGYFKIFEKYLNNYGKYLLIILFVMHPYMNIYFFRFYTDLFASIGIFLILYYKLKNININLFFVITALILINFRIALIPVFIMYGLWEMYSQYIRKNYIETFLSILLILISIFSYIPVMEFSIRFANINSEYNLIEKIIYNIVLALGYRESIGISREILILEKWTDVLSFIASLILIVIHSIGAYGIIKFSFKKDKSILIVFTYLLMPILAIAHMRYLLPLIPIMLFGFSYIIFRNPRTSI